MARVNSENSTALPAEPQEAFLYIRTPATPQEAFAAIGALRKEARDELNRLIQFLDDTDDYVSRELEDQVDDSPCDTDELEPGFCGVTADGGRLPVKAGIDEAEGDGERGGDANDEPSLGWTEQEAKYGRSYAGCSDKAAVDCEDEHDGAEPDESDDDAISEPSLGWTTDGAIGDPSGYDRELAAEPGLDTRPPTDPALSNIAEERGYPNRRAVRTAKPRPNPNPGPGR